MGSLGIESSKPEVVTIDVVAAKGLIQTTHVYLDVRTVEEFEKGHVDTVKIINIPYMFNTPEGRVKNQEFRKELLSACKKEDHVIVGCQSGVRSLYATADLLAEGFKDVSNMGGGYVDWLKNEFPVKASLAKTEYEFPVKVEASLAKPSLDQL
ncbi:thiosulfate sulfurtransferase 18-like [Lotus japonicus]|uniref:thiosulfate sulfurtransferase 18-like n=1 Tax=Lotus japonicus TaxID=34305 RepID=UPI00258D87DB|nr:thiosulfate sulfurtransferase 18-like [Lotus japonicus]